MELSLYRFFVSVQRVEITKVCYSISWYALAGCRRCKAPGMQTYAFVLQWSGNEEGSVPCERIRFFCPNL
jgi:hypothetical protein